MTHAWLFPAPVTSTSGSMTRLSNPTHPSEEWPAHQFQNPSWKTSLEEKEVLATAAAAAVYHGDNDLDMLTRAPEESLLPQRLLAKFRDPSATKMPLSYHTSQLWHYTSNDGTDIDVPNLKYYTAPVTMKPRLLDSSGLNQDCSCQLSTIEICGSAWQLFQWFLL